MILPVGYARRRILGWGMGGAYSGMGILEYAYGILGYAYGILEYAHGILEYAHGILEYACVGIPVNERDRGSSV